MRLSPAPVDWRRLTRRLLEVYTGLKPADVPGLTLKELVWLLDGGQPEGDTPADVDRAVSAARRTSCAERLARALAETRD